MFKFSLLSLIFMFSAQLVKRIEGRNISIGEKVSFNVKSNIKSALTGSSPDVAAEHWKTISFLSSNTNDLGIQISDTKNAINLMLAAYDRAPKSNESVQNELLGLRDQILELELKFGGSKPRGQVGALNEYPTIYSYIRSAGGGSTYGPTKANLKHLANANKLFDEMSSKLKQIKSSLKPLENELLNIGAPKIKK